jgi:O-Antigen ligase
MIELRVRRDRRLGLLAGVAVAVAMASSIVEYAASHDPAAAARALPAALIAVAVAGFAASLPGISVRGLVIGGFFITAGMLSWTYLNRGWVVWCVLLAEGVLFLFWAWPWLRHLRPLPRLGTAWLGLAYWLLGIVGALLVAHIGVAAQRLAYAGVFTLAAMAVVAGLRRPAAGGRLRGPGTAGTDPAVGGRPDLSVGVAAAFLFAIAALLLAGSGNLFAAIHAVPGGQWGRGMEHRFWGGPWLLYHPNSLAAIAVAAAIRIGPDRAFAAWQRSAATLVAAFVIYVTNSRTGFVFALAAAALHGYLLWRRRGGRLPEYRRRWVAAAAPFAALALVLVLSGGRGFLFKNRYGADDPTSGRLDTWKQVVVEWRGAGLAEKLFGDAKTSRAVVTRANDGTRPGEERLKLTTDNAAVGALRRGGVLGVLAFLLGLAFLLAHATWGLLDFGRLKRLWQWRGTWWQRALWPAVPEQPAARRLTAGQPASGQPASRQAGGLTGPGTSPAWFAIAAVAALPTIATSDWLLGGTGGTLWILLVAGEAWLVNQER